jgi:hypothetical protein
VLSTKYGSFAVALSDHHAGGTNVGRVIVNGERLGGADTRQRYFLGSELARDLRLLFPGVYADAYGSYGLRSFRYVEMVFGNVGNVASIRQLVPQRRIFAMRAPRAISLQEISRRTGLPAVEVRRYNPALIRQVPARGHVYLPTYIREFGPDVSFWHRAASANYADTLDEFLALDRPPEDWEGPAHIARLRRFQARFRQTGSEEGAVMAAVLGYVIADAETSGRAAILDDFRRSPHVAALVERGAVERTRAQVARAQPVSTGSSDTRRGP